MGEFKCDTCKEVFKFKKNLRRHVREVHGKQKKHECGICKKRFGRKKHKDMHLRTCSRRVTSPMQKNLDFTPVLRKSALGGCFADWKIEIPKDYRGIDLATLLSASTMSMKDVLTEHLRVQTPQLKFTMAIHTVFEQSCDPEVKTEPPVVLRTDSCAVHIASDFATILREMSEELKEKIETYEGTGSGWILEYIDRLDTDIASM